MRNGLKLMSLVGKDALGDFGATFPKIAELAKKASRVTGNEVSFMLESITNGVGRNSVMWLDNTGIVVKADEAYQEMANTLKVNVNQLTTSQQKQALLNAWIEKAEKTYKDVAVTSGGYAGTLEKLTSELEDNKNKLALTVLPTYTKFLKDVLIPLSQQVMPVVTDAIKKATDAFGNLSPSTQKALVIFLGLAAILAPLALLISALVNPITLVIAALGVMIVNWERAMNNLKVMTEATAINVKENIRGIILSFENLKDRVAINTKATADITRNNIDGMRIDLEQLMWKIKTNAVSSFEIMKNDAIYHFNNLKNGVIDSFNSLKDNLSPAIDKFKDWIKDRWASWGIHLSIPNFDELWNNIKKILDDIRNKIGSMWASWGVSINIPDVRQMFERFKNIPNWVKEQINKLPSFLKGLAEQVWSLTGGIPSFQKGGIVGGARGEPQLAVVHGGEKVEPAIGSGGHGEVNITFNFEGIFLGSQTEMRQFANKIWQSVGQIAASQNKRPEELLNLSV